MYYAGIDIAKRGHFASVVSSDGEVFIKSFRFTNDNDSFCTVLSALQNYLIFHIISLLPDSNNLKVFVHFYTLHLHIHNCLFAVMEYYTSQ